MKFVVENERDLVEKVWKFLSKKFEAGVCVGLSGDLGAGKTTLVKGIAKLMGVEEAVSSPTFMISRRYNTTDKNIPLVQHVDLYRIGKASKNDVEELVDMVSDPGCVTFVEWPELVKEILDLSAIRVRILVKGENLREVIIDED